MKPGDIAYVEGSCAFFLNRPISANPYDRECQLDLFLAFDRGYIDHLLTIEIREDLCALFAIRPDVSKEEIRGYLAAEHMIPNHSNPHDLLTIEWYDWDTGWRLARGLLCPTPA